MKTAARRQLVIGSIGIGIVLATGLIRFMNDHYRFSLLGMDLILLSYNVSFHLSGIQIAGWDGMGMLDGWSVFCTYYSVYYSV